VKRSQFCQVILSKHFNGLLACKATHFNVQLHKLKSDVKSGCKFSQNHKHVNFVQCTSCSMNVVEKKCWKILLILVFVNKSCSYIKIKKGKNIAKLLAKNKNIKKQGKAKNCNRLFTVLGGGKSS